MLKIRKLFEERFNKYKTYNEVLEYIEQKEENLAFYMYYMYVNLPLTDFFETDKEILFDYALAGDRLRKTKCRDMDEKLFLQYVLCPRVNNEEISACRNFFASYFNESLSENDIENVIKINYYCEREVTYTSTDDRTASAMTVFKSGFGRCGEESTFAVSVLRSLGIPARQVYAPLWAHCDDNHAWVEVFVDNSWHYLGACEAGEILDNGWFNDAAARAILVRSKEFAYSKEFLYEQEDVLNKFDNTYEINQTDRYAETVEICLHFKFQGKQVNTKVDILLPNYAGFELLSTMHTKDDGELKLKLGKGNIMLACEYENETMYVPIDLTDIKGTNYEVELHDYIIKHDAVNEIMWKAPLPSERNRKKAPERKENKYRKKGFPNTKSLDYLKSIDRLDIFEILSEKDKRDIGINCLKDIKDTYNKFNVENDIYDRYILNPRVKFEILKPCRKFLADKFRSVSDIKEFIQSIELKDFLGIISAVNVYENKIANLESLNIFIVNALRAISIPAKLENDNVYFIDANVDKDLFVPFNGEFLIEMEINGNIKEYLKNFTIAKKVGRAYKTLEETSIKKSMKLGAGNYLLTTSIRLPNGNQALAYKFFLVGKDRIKEIEPKYMEFDIEDTLSSIKLIDKIKEYSDNFNDEFKLIIWLEENAEPSKHIVNELLESSICKDMKKILLFSNELKNSDISINKLLKEKNIAIKDKLGDKLSESFGRSIFVNHETLPIVALIKDNKVRYANSGYQVGVIAMIEKLIKVLGDGE